MAICAHCRTEVADGREIVVHSKNKNSPNLWSVPTVPLP